MMNGGTNFQVKITESSNSDTSNNIPITAGLCAGQLVVSGQGTDQTVYVEDSTFKEEKSNTTTLTSSAYHYARSSCRIVDWNLKVTKEFLILGYANVHRFPDISYSDFQIDSYPNVTFYHLLKLMEKTRRNETKHLVIFSTGSTQQRTGPYENLN